VWGDVYLLIAAVFSLTIISKKYPGGVKDIKITSIFALIVYILSEMIVLIDLEIVAIISSILLITALSLVFVILLMLIRNLKPIVFQYPYPVVFLPLLLPVSFLFVTDTIIVEQIILASIQAVVIVVLFLLTSGYIHYLEKKAGMYSGLLLLIASFVLYWMVKEIINVPTYLWKLFLSIGMVLIIYSLSGLINNKINNDKVTE